MTNERTTRMIWIACPHCWEPKQFWAPRCHHCNSDTSVKHQFYDLGLRIVIRLILIPLFLIGCAALLIGVFGS